MVVKSATRVDWLRGRQDAALVLPTRADTSEYQICTGQYAVWKHQVDTQRYPVWFDVLRPRARCSARLVILVDAIASRVVQDDWRRKGEAVVGRERERATGGVLLFAEGAAYRQGCLPITGQPRRVFCDAPFKLLGEGGGRPVCATMLHITG